MQDLYFPLLFPPVFKRYGPVEDHPARTGVLIKYKIAFPHKLVAFAHFSIDIDSIILVLRQISDFWTLRF